MTRRALQGTGLSLTLALTFLLVPVRGASAQITEFGFHFDGRIIIPVQVDEQEPIQVILDSGLGNRLLILLHTETGEELGLEYVKTVPAVRGAGSGENKDLHLTAGDELSVPGLQLGTLPVGVIGESRTVSNLYNKGVAGGLLLFKYTVEIDFDASIIIVHDPESFETADGWEAIPLDFAKNLPVLETTITMGDRVDIPVRLIVDTGGRAPLGLTVDEEKGLIPGPDAIRTLTGTGLRGDVFGELGRIDRVDLGPFTLRDVVCGFGFTEDAPILNEIDADGVIGIGALYRYNIIFDFARRRMLVKPNHFVANPYEWNMAGVDIRPDPLGRTVIYHVDEGSEAAAKGLKKGDVVEAVDGRSPADYTYLELKKVFEQEGKVVELRIRNDRETRVVQVTLRRVV